jgi:hypothetical protein
MTARTLDDDIAALIAAHSAVDLVDGLLDCPIGDALAAEALRAAFDAGEAINPDNDDEDEDEDPFADIPYAVFDRLAEAIVGHREEEAFDILSSIAPGRVRPASTTRFLMEARKKCA